MNDTLSCFKAYDVRGELGVNFDGDICYRIGRAFAQSLQAKRVVVGRDARKSSPELAQRLAQGLMDQGVEVLGIGLCGTEEMYWATTEFDACGGIEVTASHNPINYNGLKMVKSQSRPLDPATELLDIKALAEKNVFEISAQLGYLTDMQAVAKRAYVTKVLSFVDLGALRPMSIVVNSGNGAAGPSFDEIERYLSAQTSAVKFHRMFHEPDSSFPNGIPNPLLKKNHAPTRDMVLSVGADFGVAFDGDFDRCFFFDELGQFVPGEYIVGLLASVFLNKEAGATIVHDPRVTWNTQDIIAAKGGVAVQAKTGHAFIKQVMRAHDAVYGGEMSAHHYFRDFAFCDSGMVPWLLVVELMSRTGTSLSELVRARKAAFPSSGEVNFTLAEPKAAMARVVAHYRPLALSVDEADGISLSFGDWRFNLRSSNTEPVVRLNVESRGDPALVARKLAEIVSIWSDDLS